MVASNSQTIGWTLRWDKNQTGTMSIWEQANNFHRSSNLSNPKTLKRASLSKITNHLISQIISHYSKPHPFQIYSSLTKCNSLSKWIRRPKRIRIISPLNSARVSPTVPKKQTHARTTLTTRWKLQGKPRRLTLALSKKRRVSSQVPPTKARSQPYANQTTHRPTKKSAKLWSNLET